MLPTMNIVVSNVRGPDVPMFLAGAQMVAFAPVSIAMDGLGLNITGFSYHGTLWMCAVACRDMVPDPAFLADCLRSSFADLVCRSRERTRQGGRAHHAHQGEIAGPQACRPARKDRQEGTRSVAARIAQACVQPPEDRVNAGPSVADFCFGAARSGHATSGHISAAWQQRNDQTGCHERASLATFGTYGYWQSRFGYSRVLVW